MDLADGQIYLNKDRKASEVLLEKVTKLGAAAVIFTVDTAWKSKRTRDVRAKTTVQVRHHAPLSGGLDRGKRHD
jgi:isopentenyl diphosphate isomerase/L-lactate dehydrogenase-like FMN-dependent dehydrogenase